MAGPGYDAITGTVGVTTDDMWHGTFVSGIIAADVVGPHLGSLPPRAKSERK